MTLTTHKRNLLFNWADAMRAQGQSAATITRRTGTIRRIEDALGKDADKLGVDDITSWLSRYRQSGTRAAYFGDLEAYYAWRHLRGELEVSPTSRIRRPHQPRRRPRPITTEQLYRGLDTATGDLLVWIKLGAYQGLRVSEAAAVAGDLIEGDLMRVLGKGDSDKTIPLHEELAAEAAARPGRGWWFPGQTPGTHITSHTVAARVCAHFASIGVLGFTFHRLRHWCGTEMLRAGADLREAQEFMRHDSIGSTVLYTLVLQDDLRTAAARLPRRPRLRIASTA